ncbi:MAG: DUF624 domain-containing protein [Clostridiaceae bacterium]|nr:DUF624 domain-containing protein [Clostridiaceae bacterium]
MNFISYNSPFGRLMNRLVDIVVLSLLTMLLCLPIITIGAAFTALYSVLLKVIRETDQNIIRTYFKAFKSNFFKSTVLWAIMAVVIFILYMDFYLLSAVAMANEDLIRIVLLIISAFIAMVGSYIFPMQAQFENSIFGTIKKSFLICIMNLPRSIAILGVLLCPILVVLFFPETVYFLLIFCIGAIPYLQTEIFVRVFDRYMPKAPEEPTPVDLSYGRHKNMNLHSEDLNSSADAISGDSP